MSKDLKNCLYKHALLIHPINVEEVINIIKQHTATLKETLLLAQAGLNPKYDSCVDINTQAIKDQIYTVSDSIEFCYYQLSSYYDSVTVHDDLSISYTFSSNARSPVNNDRYYFGEYTVTIYPHSKPIMTPTELPITITPPEHASQYPRGYIYPGIKCNFIESLKEPEDFIAAINKFQYYAIFSFLHSLFNTCMPNRHNVKWDKWKIVHSQI